MIGSIVLLTLVLVAGIVVAVTSGSASTGETATPPLSSTPSADGGDSVCGIPAGDQSIPTVTGPEVEWELIGRIAAPSSPESGPGMIVEGLRSCFAKSPTGALLATANFYAQGSSPELAVRNAETFIAAGPARDLVVQSTKESASAGTIGGSPDVSVQFAGYQILDYTGETATIDIVGRGSQGVLGSYVTNLVWQDGDWKVVLQSNGQPAVPMRQVQNLVGYVPWAGA